MHSNAPADEATAAADVDIRGCRFMREGLCDGVIQCPAVLLYLRTYISTCI